MTTIKLKLLIFAVCVFAAVCVSCNNVDEEILTEKPSNITFALYYLDENGNNLLNDKDCLNDISIQSGDFVYKPRSEKDVVFSSSIINLVYSESNTGNITLTYGYFEGKDTYDINFTIKWGDGISDVVRLVNVAEVKSGGYKLTRKYYLNDVLLEAPIIHHVKK